MPFHSNCPSETIDEKNVATSDEVYEVMKRLFGLPDNVVSCEINLTAQSIARVTVELEVNINKFGPTYEHQIYKLIPYNKT